MALTSVGYALACFVYIALFALFLSSRHKTEAGRWASLASGTTAIWAAALAVKGDGDDSLDWLIGMLEALRYAVWLIAARRIAQVSLDSRLTRALVVGWAALLILMLASPAASLFGFGDSLLPQGLVNLANLVLALAGLLLLEQFLRSSVPATRAATKLVVIGIGGQFAYDLFMYAQAQLLSTIEPLAWSGRGIVVSLLAPCIVLATRRLGKAGPTLFISRHVVFYTGTLVVVGGYLSLMALGGYYVRARGGVWGEALQLAFLLGAAIVLAAILLSASTWRRFRVLIATHFYRSKYDYRLEWLRFIKTLSSAAAGDVRQIAIRSVAQIFHSPRGALLLRTDGTGSFTPVAAWSESGPEATDVVGFTASAELIRFLEERQWVVDLAQYRRSPHVYRHMQLPQWLEASAEWRIAVPLLDLDRLVGVLVLGSPPEPFAMNFEDRDLLRTVGRHVAVHIGQQEAARQLTESRQFDAYNRFAAFVMHDLKNSVAQLQLLVSNAARHRHNPAFIEDAISTIANSVGRMTGLIEQLQGRDVNLQPCEVPMNALLQSAAARARVRRPAIAVEGADAVATVLADPDKLGSVLDHVIRNAQEATGELGSVIVHLRAEPAHAIVEVEDDGPGMEAEFVRDRLFRPFDTTKGSKGMGIGVYQTRHYVRQIGGDVEVQSSPGRGTIFRITLPLCQKKAPTS